jgi:hypothetical protein
MHCLICSTWIGAWRHHCHVCGTTRKFQFWQASYVRPSAWHWTQIDQDRCIGRAHAESVMNLRLPDDEAFAETWNIQE